MIRMIRRQILLAIVALLIIFCIYKQQQPCDASALYDHRKEHVVQDEYVKRDKDGPLIFIGGVPRSGTTLARAMLDAHPDIRCGEETRIIPRIIQMRNQWKKNTNETVRLIEAGITDKILDESISTFILDIIRKHGEPAQWLCNKDPITLKYATYLGKLFPRAKFLFMVRDGRATVHSIISRKVTISGFDLKSYRNNLKSWNILIQHMHNQCQELGPDRCLHVYYEQLVLQPQAWMVKILDFLGVPWNDAVLHHEEHINKPGGVSLSKVEKSSDQVIKPVNLEALSKWVGHIPKDVVEDMANIAPMLAILGYNPKANSPYYGPANLIVKNNTFNIRKMSQFWDLKAKQVLAKSKLQDQQQ